MASYSKREFQEAHMLNRKLTSKNYHFEAELTNMNMLQKNKFLVASSDSVTTLLQNQSFTQIIYSIRYKQNLIISTILKIQTTNPLQS
jgi:hypothetical protein